MQAASQRNTPGTLDDKVLVFVHIPKAAGSTLHHLLEMQYAPEESFATCSTPRYPHNDLTHFEALGEDELARIRLLNGHMGYGLHRRLPRPAVYITYLREPVERVLSHYSFERTLPQSPVYPYLQSGDMDLKEYVRYYTEAAEMDNLQTRMIAGNWHKRGFGPCTPAMLDEAKHNLRERFAVIGLAEAFDASYLLLKRYFGWRLTYFSRRNKTRERLYRDHISSDELAYICDHNRFDLELYAYACELFDAQIRRQGPSFQVELALFRVQNRLYNRYKKVRTYSVRTQVRRLLGRAGHQSDSIHSGAREAG